MIRKKDAEKYIQYWKPILDLIGWSYNVAITNNLENSDAEAEIVVQPDVKHFFIRIRPDILKKELEEVIVHEMLHVHFHPFERRDPEHIRISEEAAIQTITRALLSLKNSQPK